MKWEECQYKFANSEIFSFFKLECFLHSTPLYVSITSKKKIRPRRPPDGNGFPSIRLLRNRFQIFLAFPAHNQSNIRCFYHITADFGFQFGKERWDKENARS